MRYRRQIVLLVVTLLLCGSVQIKAAQGRQQTTVKETIVRETIPFSRELVIKYLAKCDSRIKNGDAKGNTLDSGFYLLFAYRVKKWLQQSKQHPWNPELPSMIAWSWYVDLYKTFLAMAKYRHIREQLENKKLDKTPRYKLAGEKFIEAYKHFKELQKKPTKLTKKRYHELLKAKKAWEKKQRELARVKKRRKRRY